MYKIMLIGDRQSGCCFFSSQRMRLFEEKNQRMEQLLMKSTVEVLATTFPRSLIAMNVHENEVFKNTLAMPSPAYELPRRVIESETIAQQVAFIHGEGGVELMIKKLI